MKKTFFEDFAIGDEFITPGRTVTEADVMLFAGLTGDYNRIHTDAEYMKSSMFGERIAHGLLGLSLVHG
jgi:acyl dehydratase